jgi:hypothetical protein
VLAFGVAFFAACVVDDRRPVSSPLPTTTSAPAPPAADAGRVDAGASADPPRAPMRLEPLAPKPPPSPAPHVEILFPFAEQRIQIPKAPTYNVRVKVESWPLGAEGAGVEVLLDDGRPRRIVPGGKIELQSLAGDGRPLAQGPHVLFAAVRDADGSIVRSSGGSLASFAMVRFWIGDRDPSFKPGPSVALFEPHGTYHGARAADALLIDFLALPERMGVERGSARVRASVRGAQPIEQLLTSWQPVALKNAPSGDIDIEVSMLDADGKPIAGARAARTITVNREAGAPAAQ